MVKMKVKLNIGDQNHVSLLPKSVEHEGSYELQTILASTLDLKKNIQLW